jgi:Trk K+ transport system NAD-binding subunit
MYVEEGTPMSDTVSSTTGNVPETDIHETRYERLRRKQRLPFRRWLAAFLYDVLTLLHEARVPLIGFIVVMASSTFYWTLIYQEADYSVGAALFETMRMLALEHSRDFPPDLLGKILFFAIPGFGLVFVFQGVIDFGRLLLDKSGRLEGWQVSLARTHQNHIILCGLGRVSYRAMVQLLESGYDVVVVEKDWQSEFVQDVLALNVPVIHGDARNPQVLRQAGLWRARSLMTAISEDLLNIEIALVARRLRPGMHVVLRIFNERLDHNLENSKFGLNTAFSSSALAAPTLAAAAVSRGIRSALPLSDQMLGIAEITVSDGGKLDNLVYKIEQEFQVQVISHSGENESGEQCWRHRVSPSTRLYGGDRLLLLGAFHNLGDVWQHGHERNRIMATLGIEMHQRPTARYDRVLVCGLGKVGFRVVQVLHQLDPRPEIVVICDFKSTRPRFIKEVRALGVEVIDGDARVEETLLTAGLRRAYSVAAVTSNNLTNLRIGLTARHLRSDIHLVLRVFSDVLAEQLESMFGIHTVFSTSALAAPTLAAAAVVRGTGYAVDIGGRLMSTARFTVQRGDEFEGQRIDTLREQRGMVLVSLRRGSQTMLLPGDAASGGNLFERVLQVGDELVVLTEIHSVDRLRGRGAKTDATGARITRRLPPISTAHLGEQSRATGAEAPPAASPAQTAPAPDTSGQTQSLLEYLLQHEIASKQE